MAVRDIRATGSPQDIREVVRSVNQLVAAVVDLQTKYNAALAKLDADAGVTDTDYVATQAAASATDTIAVRF